MKNISVLIIRTGFWGPLNHHHFKEPLKLHAAQVILRPLYYNGGHNVGISLTVRNDKNIDILL